MDAKEALPRSSAAQCEHLGIKDDPGTCLAFPSNWNYCHRARPPHSVRLDYQGHYCQSLAHVRCVIFQSKNALPLPPDIRGRQVPHRYTGNALRLVPWILLFVTLSAGLIWLAGSRGFIKAGAPFFGGVPTRMPAFAVVPSPAPSNTEPISPILAARATSMPTLANFSITRVAFKAAPATVTPISTAPGLCGHQLDEPIGLDRKFVIHQVKYGDSLNMFEITYRTTLEAIQRVNLPFPIPLRREQILIMPFGQADVANLPLLSAYQAANRNTSVQTMAFKVSADLQAFEQYNLFDNNCMDFSGWVLVPHQRPAP